MTKGLSIKEIAKERGITLLTIAKKLGIHRSNMSAIASGKRGVSLKRLKKICYLLDCSIDELVFSGSNPLVFKNKKAQAGLDLLEKVNSDGADKTWVNRVMLAGLTHYKYAKRVV